MSTLKFGFIGAGFISNFHLKALQFVRDVEIAGVFSLERSEDLQAKSKAAGTGPCNVYSTVKGLCEHVDVVCLYAPNPVRLELMEQIAEAVEAGAALKGIIVEKPLGRTVQEARKIVEIARRTGVPNAYFENQIHMKGMKAAIQQLAPQARTMGPLALARSAEEHGGPHEPWFWDPTRQGGGVLSDMGCHSIAVGWRVLTPPDKPVDFLQPVAVTAETALLKWGTPKWRDALLERTGVDYNKTPAEDFATGVITFKNPETGQLVQAQFTNSWMYDKQGLRLLMDGLGPGYAFEMNSLQTPLNIFIGDEAAEATADAELALEKATSSRGLLAVEPNEADLYGYTDENVDAIAAFNAGRDGMLNLDYGLEITKLAQAAYMAAERGRKIDLTDKKTQQELETYTSLIAQGRGAEVLFG